MADNVRRTFRSLYDIELKLTGSLEFHTSAALSRAMVDNTVGFPQKQNIRKTLLNQGMARLIGGSLIHNRHSAACRRCFLLQWLG